MESYPGPTRPAAHPATGIMATTTGMSRGNATRGGATSVAKLSLPSLTKRRAPPLTMGHVASLTRSATFGEPRWFRTHWRNAHYHLGDIYQDDVQEEERQQWALQR